MKFIALIFAILIVSSMGGIVNRKKLFGRTSTPESIDFQLLYLGTCNEFNSIAKVTVSSIANGGCLPINPTSPFAAIDDLTADVLCTNIGRNRAQIDFVEIFNGTEATPYTGGFAISFVPNKPFKAISGQVSYLRRPSCTTQKDYCSTTTYVHSCTENPAVTKNGFIISNDEIFIISNQLTAVGCGQAVNTCCGYLSTLCPRTAPNTLLKFNWDHHEYNSYNDHDDHHDNHHDDHHDDHHDNHHDDHNDHHNDDHHDNHHNDHHDDNHHNNGHQGNGHQGNGNHGHGHKSEDNNKQHTVVFDDEEDEKKKK